MIVEQINPRNAFSILGVKISFNVLERVPNRRQFDPCF